MNFNNIFTVYFKELKEAVRDRRTLMSMIVIPTLIIPGLMAGVGTISMKVIKQVRNETAPVVIIGGADSPRFVEAIKGLEKIKVEPLTDDWKQRISDKKIRAAVEIPAGFEAALGTASSANQALTIYNYEGELKSGFALNELRKKLNELRDTVITERLAARGLPADLTKPFEIKTQNVAPPEKVGGNAIGGIIPYMFIILCFTGAMYPAIDVTAGEKERGTMETILCSPISRLDLVLGKFLTVLTASLTTVVCSCLSLTATFLIGGPLLFGSGDKAASAAKVVAGAAAKAAPAMPSLDPAGLLTVLAMVIPVAVFFAGVLLSIALFAKTYKEAQSYIAPLVAVIIMPAVMAMLPGVELNLKLALIPILNVSLVSKELVSGVFHWDLIAVIFGSSCVYAGVALAFCVKMFNREDVIFRT